MWGDEEEGKPGQVGSGLFSCPRPATRRPAAAGRGAGAAEGARAGMNDPPGRASWGARSQIPVLPAGPAPRCPPSPDFWARAASAQNLEELGREAQAGDSGWLRRPRVCYCSFSGSREPFGGPRGAGLLVPLAFRVLFPRRSFEEGEEAGMLEFGQTRGNWDLRRGAPARCLPQPLPRWVGALSNPPSLRCRLGQVCVRALVSAVFRVHLLRPGTRSPLRLDLTLPFCEAGPQSPGRQQTGQMETSVKWGLQVTFQGLGCMSRLALLQGTQVSATLSPAVRAYLGLQAAHHNQQLPVAAGAQVIWMGLRFPSGRGEHQAGWDRETLPVRWRM